MDGLRWKLLPHFRAPISEFYLSLFLSVSHWPLESLYRLRHPRCAPQSSVDGLEDMEVSPYHPTSNHIELFFQFLLISSLSPSCRGSAGRNYSSWWFMEVISWILEVATLEGRRVMLPLWRPCWSVWLGHTSKQQQTACWSDWCPARPFVLMPSRWFQSKMLKQKCKAKYANSL